VTVYLSDEAILQGSSSALRTNIAEKTIRLFEQFISPASGCEGVELIRMSANDMLKIQPGGCAAIIGIKCIEIGRIRLLKRESNPLRSPGESQLSRSNTERFPRSILRLDSFSRGCLSVGWQNYKSGQNRWVVAASSLIGRARHSVRAVIRMAKGDHGVARLPIG
jgi:hypothetical protein